MNIVVRMQTRPQSEMSDDIAEVTQVAFQFGNSVLLCPKAPYDKPHCATNLLPVA